MGRPGEDEASAKITYAGGDGSSCENAVVIKGAVDTFQGIDAENNWIRQHFAKGVRVSTKSGDCQDRITDVVGIRMPDGTLKTVIFDISDFYGKW